MKNKKPFLYGRMDKNKIPIWTALKSSFIYHDNWDYIQSEDFNCNLNNPIKGVKL